VKGFENRRVKNDDKDATLLADLLRMGSLPESRMTPPSQRQLQDSHHIVRGGRMPRPTASPPNRGWSRHQPCPYQTDHHHLR
jgi:hypothetical protein